MNLDNLGFSPTSKTELRYALEGLAPIAIRPYPWVGMKPEFDVVVYGSLLNPISAARTLTTSPQERRPVLAVGARRVFDFEMPDAAFVHYGTPPDPRSRAALNVHITGDISDAVNGLLVTIASTAELEAFRQREVGYDLAPVVYLTWGQLDVAPQVAYILTCRRGSPSASGDRESLLPHPNYFQVCREGAASVSESFLHFFLDATFIADGITPIAAWERQAFPGGFGSDRPAPA
jgi:hypothetical protein